MLDKQVGVNVICGLCIAMFLRCMCVCFKSKCILNLDFCIQIYVGVKFKSEREAFVRLSRPACHHPTQNPFSSFSLLSYLFHYSSGVRSVCYFVCFLLFASIPIVVDHLLYLFLYSIHCLSFFTGVIYLLFLKMGLCRCNAPCTTHF